MTNVTVSMQKDLLDLIDKEIQQKHVTSRSEFVSMVVRHYFEDMEVENAFVDPIHATDRDAVFLASTGKGTYITLEDLDS